MPAFPGSSCGRFSVPLKAADKGNGKNLAARYALPADDLLFDSPLAFLTAVLLGLAIRGWQTTKQPLRSTLPMQSLYHIPSSMY